MKTTAIVARLFNGGAGRPDETGAIQPLNQKWFSQKMSELEVLLPSPHIQTLVVANNRDPSSKFGEAPDKNGDTPTGRAVKRYFEHDPRVKMVYVDEWGNNAGSGRAVQAGVEYLLTHDSSDTIMIWSPELAITPEKLSQALYFMQQFNHDVVGFLREHWQDKPQWMLPQHTGLIGTRDHWRIAPVPKKADGDEGRTVQTDRGPVALAGMDDFCRLLDVWTKDPNLSIGMFGRSEPIEWNIDMSDQRQLDKIARQYQVALQYAADKFPERDPQETIDLFFRHVSIP